MTDPPISPPIIFVDADACPVKNEVYRVAERHGLKVYVVANSPMRMPAEPSIELVIVGGSFDASDDWIVERVRPNDIVITADVPLASRCVRKEARVLGHRGREFTPENVGSAVVSRDILASLRDSGAMTSGPPPFEKKDRSKFLDRLETMVRASKKGPKPNWSEE